MTKTYFEQIPLEEVAKLLNRQAGTTDRAARELQEINPGLASVMPKVEISPKPGQGMESAMKKQWQLLCEKAINEQNPDSFIDLIEELNRALGEEEARPTRRTERS